MTRPRLRGAAPEYLAYLPASNVGMSRLEGQRQLLADIRFGAALGMSVANWLHNAHSGGDGAPGIFGTDSRIRLSFGPATDAPGLAVGLQWTS